MSILCSIFGHKPPTYGRNAGSEYGRISNTGTDGTGRHHGWVYGNCPRCGEEYHVCNVHQHRDRPDADRVSPYALAVANDAYKAAQGKQPMKAALLAFLKYLRDSQ